MTSALLAYIFYFITATASPLWLRQLKKSNAQGGEIGLAFRVMIILATLGSLTLPWISPFHIIGTPWVITLLAATCGIFGAGYFIASYVAQKHVEAGISALTLTIYVPLTIVFSTLLLGEGLKPLQILGTALLLIALFVISKKHRTGTFKFDKYFLLMLSAGVMMGVLLVCERALQKTTGFTGGTLLSWWSQCAGLGIATLIFHSKSIYNLKDTLVTGSLRFLSAFAWVLLIYVVGNLSVVSAVTTFEVVVIFIAAAIFLKEREDLPRKIIGSLIAVAGLLLMR